MDKTHQRVGAKSNAHVGREFELETKEFFASQGLDLVINVKVEVSAGATTKNTP